MMRRCTLWVLIPLALLLVRPAAATFEGARADAASALDAWDLAGATEALTKMSRVDAMHPDTLALTGRFHLLKGRYQEAVEYLAQARQVGAGEAVTWLLTLAENTRRETAEFVHHTSASGRFVISHAPGPDGVLVPYMEEVLERTYEVIKDRFEFAPVTPIRVEIYPRVDVLGAVSPLTVDEIETSGTIALCKYNRLMLVSPRALVYGYGWADTVAHEFIHLVITQKSRDRVPVWLHEGLAKYHESLWRQETSPRLSRRQEDLLARGLRDDTLISFDEMSPSMAKLPSQEATGLAFAEVFSVVQFLVARQGVQVVRDLVDLMGSGLSDQAAIEEASGVSWSRFQALWRAHLRQRGLRTLKDVFDHRLLFRGHNTEAQELDALRGERARKLTWLGDQLRLKGRWQAAVVEYGKAAAEVGDHTPLIQSKLGYALLRLDDVDGAIEALKKPLRFYGNYVLLYLYLGEALLRRGDLAAARGYLEEANRLNPFDPQLHSHLAEVYEGLGESELAQRERWAHTQVTGP